MNMQELRDENKRLKEENRRLKATGLNAKLNTTDAYDERVLREEILSIKDRRERQELIRKNSHLFKK